MMTKNTMKQTFHNQPHDVTETTRDSPWDSASQMVASFRNEPLFLTQLHEKHIDIADVASEEYMYTLSQYAHDFCTANESLLGEDESSKITLIADSPGVVSVQTKINQLEDERRHRRLTDEEWSYLNKDLKPFAIGFNQRLSDYITSHPNEKFSDINRALIEPSLSFYPKHEHLVESGLKAITKGARYEAVTRQVLAETPIDFRPATIDEDKRGGDIALTYNGQTVLVDIKASLDQIAKLRGGYDSMQNQSVTYAISPPRKAEKYGSIKLYPGFTHTELGDTCGLPSELLQEKAMFISVQLQRALNELRI